MTRFRTALDAPRAMQRLAVPIMLIALVNMGLGVADTTMVSTGFGPDALAAVAVSSDVRSIPFYLGAGTIGGLVPVYAAAIARADAPEGTGPERTGPVIVLMLAALRVTLVRSAHRGRDAGGVLSFPVEQWRGIGPCRNTSMAARHPAAQILGARSCAQGILPRPSRATLRS